MLELRPNCECCDKNLPPESREAMICSFECTFCAACAEDVLGGKCPTVAANSPAARFARSGSSPTIRRRPNVY